MRGEELTRLLEPTVERLGYELADLELKIAGRDSVIRVFIDKPEGSGEAVGLGDCETVSRQVSAVLDVEDPLPGHYVLEVSSPGLDRKLTKPAHFRRYVGADIRVQLRFPLEGRRKFRGKLTAASEQTIELEVDGRSHELPIATIETARLVPSL
ncbi:MAG: ribosome maturation factor RimP [Woeseia sp.]